MHTLADIHHQFAEAFEEPEIRPLAYLLSQKLLDGNICITEDDIRTLGPSTPYYTASIPDSQNLPLLLSEEPNANVPFIKQGDRYYFQRYFRYETNIINKISSFIQRSEACRVQRMNELEACKDIFPALSATYPIQSDMTEAESIDWQLIAAIQAQLNDFFIITGGPGTGKTTTLAKLLRIMLTIHPESKIVLAAPTGKASMRMRDSLNSSTHTFKEMFTEEIRKKIISLPKSTLHKLLVNKKNSIYFKKDAADPLDYDAVIVDEASMIDVPMFSKLLNAMKPGSKLILLGDKDQLASVEAGSLFGDLCNSAIPFNQYPPAMAEWINQFITEQARKIQPSFQQNPQAVLTPLIVELKRSHRFQNQGALGKLSKAIITGSATDVEEIMNIPDQHIVFDHTYDTKILEAFTRGFEKYMQTDNIAEALTILNDIRVLVAVRQGEHGLHALNKKIELILESRKCITKEHVFYINRPVMITKNNYDLQLYNGDIGIVRPDELGHLRVWFEGAEGKLRSFLPAYIADCETVYAMTIHKSQGSEFSNVMVVLPEGTDTPLLTRELLYTAITRTKQNGKLIISGSAETIVHTTNCAVERISGIEERIKTITV